MVIETIARVFRDRGHRWSIGGVKRTPTEEDVQTVLDEAAQRLYDSPIGTQFETGGLIIEKRPRGHDVFVYVGNYL